MSGLFSGLGERYKRWRHTRGYGVHSPYAFRIVSRVVHPESGYSYYGEKQLSVLPVRNADAELRKSARLLLRLAAETDVAKAYLSPECSPLLEDALKLANSNVGITRDLSEIGECDLICASADSLDEERLIRAIRDNAWTGIMLLKSSQELNMRLFDVVGDGLMLHGESKVILLNRKGMQKVAYSVKI